MSIIDKLIWKIYETHKVIISTLVTYYTNQNVYWPLTNVLPNVVFVASFRVTDGRNDETFTVSKLLSDTDNADLELIQGTGNQLYLKVFPRFY